MCTAIITPKKLSGTITAPPSKSELHRAIICAVMAEGPSEINNVSLSNDILATLNAVKALGASVMFAENKLMINGSSAFKGNKVEIDCDESGSTLRFLIPIVASFGIDATFRGKEGLAKRPLGPYLDTLPGHGVNINFNNRFPLNLSGCLKGGRFAVPGDISSQFISGLLFALPRLSHDSEIYISSPLESSNYVDLTIGILSHFGIEIIKKENTFFIPGKQTFKAATYNVGGDWSSASFFAVAGALGDTVHINGLSVDSLQGDKAILKVLEKYGINYNFSGDMLSVYPSEINPTDIYSAQIPDLVPILSVLAAKANGPSKIWGASRLKYKESNRLRAIFQYLKVFGADLEETDDGFIINGKSEFSKCALKGCNDHRIVMAMAIAATVAAGKVSISDAQAIHKSYPNFFEDFIKLGGIVNVISLD